MKVKIVTGWMEDGDIAFFRVFKATTPTKKIVSKIAEEYFDMIGEVEPKLRPKTLKALGEAIELKIEIAMETVEG